MPTSAACRASASLTPSPRNATPSTAAALRAHDARLVLRADPREDVVVPIAAASCVVVKGVDVSAGQRAAADEPEVVADLDRDAALSPVTTLTAIPRAASRRSDLGGVELGRVEEHEEARPSSRSRSSVAVAASLPAPARVATATTRLPGGELGRERLRAAAGTSTQRSITVSGAPFVISSVARLRGSRDEDRDHHGGRGRTAARAKRSYPASAARSRPPPGSPTSAWSSGFPPTALPSLSAFSVHSRPHRSTAFGASTRGGRYGAHEVDPAERSASRSCR